MSDATAATTVFPDGRDRWPVSRKAGRAMSLGVMIPISEGSHFGGLPRFADMLEICQTAENVGFDTAWFADHLVIGPPDDLATQRGVWECFTMMSGVAAGTKTIGLGSLVACTGFRNAGLLAKTAEAVDEISGGRLILGLGAGWHEPEYRMFGYPFDHRASRFEEALQVVHPLLRNESVTYAGEYVQADSSYNRPVGPRPGGIPILVGTTGHRMLRLTARYADAWNTVWHKDPATAAEKMALVDAACLDVGRDPATLVRTAGGNVAGEGYTGVRPDPFTGSPEEIAENIRAFAALGFAHFVVGLDPCTPKSLEAFAKVIDLSEA